MKSFKKVYSSSPRCEKADKFFGQNVFFAFQIDILISRSILKFLRYS